MLLDRSQTVDYIRSLLGELCEMASKTDMDTLTYLLRMALLELQEAGGKGISHEPDGGKDKPSAGRTG
jgi:hypothetical protein